MAVFRLAAYLLAVALMTALARAVVESPPDVVAVFVETDFEIPSLAYYDGREFKPVHVAYVGGGGRRRIGSRPTPQSAYPRGTSKKP